MKRLLALAAIILCAATQAMASSAKVRRHAAGVANQFLVVLPTSTHSDAVAGIAHGLAEQYKLTVKIVWRYSLRGFLCTGPAAAIQAVADDPRVLYAEQDVDGVMQEPRVSSSQFTYYDPSPTCDPNNPPTCNYNYLWFLDRLDKLTWANRNGMYNMCPEGRSVTAYIIDLGVWRDHPEFETPSRVITQLDFSEDRADLSVPFGPDTTNGCHDTNGTTYTTFNPSEWHGTAVAGALAGTHIGSSKAQIVSLKFARCSNGSFHDSDIVNAVEWIATPGTNGNPNLGMPGVINHSGFVPSWDATNFRAYGDAVAGTVAATHFPFFTAANNYSSDSCQFSPADRAVTRNNGRIGSTFSVAGTSVADGDNNDYRFQNWDSPCVSSIGVDCGSNSGGCVSAFAPAVGIYGAVLTPPANSIFPYQVLLPGTSFASPLVAGMAARYIEQRIQASPTHQLPSETDVYNFFLNQSVTAVQNDQTTTTYWACVGNLAGENRFYFVPYRTNPGSCGTNGTQLVQYNAVTNTSGARMIYWPATCP